MFDDMPIKTDSEFVSSKHRTLYHYTKMDGFRAIFASQNMRAKHFRQLNDSSEITHIRERLFRALVPKVKQYVKANRGELKQVIREYGGMGKLAKHQANAVMTAMFDVTFGSGQREPAFTPYVTSFCSHSDDDSYTQKNGLLSMWRGYGSDGGVAILFDTASVEALLELEHEEFHHNSVSLGDIIYDDDDEGFDREFGTFVDLFLERCEALLYGEENFSLGNDFLKKFLDACPRYKHRAFSEEREVRLTAYPWDNRHFQHGSDANKRKKKRKHTFVIDGAEYIALFDGQHSARLPIEAVIVGPHPEQREREREVKVMVRGQRGIDVWCSETPYLPLSV